MLVSAGVPMRRLIAFTHIVFVARWTRLLSLMLVALAAPITLLAQTESSIAVPSQSTSAILPVDHPPAAGLSFAVPNLGVPTVRFDAAGFGFGKSRLQPFVTPEGAGENSPQWSRSMLDPFQPGPNFGKFSGSNESPSRFGAAAIRGHQDRFGSAFQIGDRSPYGRASDREGARPASSIALPSFDALMRGSRIQPINSSLGGFRLSNREMPRLSGDGVDFSHPLGSSTIINSDLGNGVLFSAGTGNGGRAAGAPAASLGNATPGTKHSGASLDLKLSF